jgi:hypothetical protein
VKRFALGLGMLATAALALVAASLLLCLAPGPWQNSRADVELDLLGVERDTPGPQPVESLAECLRQGSRCR